MLQDILLTARLSMGLSAVFLGLLLILHFLEPEIDPSWRWISEFALGRVGWLMSVAFFFWGGAVLALLIAIWPSLHGVTGWISRGWLALISTALVGAGIFVTDPTDSSESTWTGKLHGVCGAFVIFTFPLAGTLTAVSLAQSASWAQVQPLLTLAAVVPWAGLITFFASLMMWRQRIIEVGGLGPQVPVGWQNRFMVVTYHLWLLIVAWQVAAIGVH